ncbi:4-amino-4-deoxy-L-arabinose-phosphoundecaprenol flippase subunit ArnE [Marinobacteraceae bacterium S3BR75-40.1]
MNFLLLIAACLFTCCGQLFQKQAVEAWRGQPVTLNRLAGSPWLWAAIGSLGLGMLLWLLVLQRMAVGIAYPMLSLNFVLVTLASALWFGEPVDRRHWLGVALIVAGIVLLRGS